MKYRIAYAIACTVDWVDDKVCGHGDRQPLFWLALRIWGADRVIDYGVDAHGEVSSTFAKFVDNVLWYYPLCRWSYNLHEWAAEQCCDVGCVRCS